MLAETQLTPVYWCTHLS